MNNVITIESSSLSQQLLNKVPEITIFFWIIKVLCTTVGETAADFLNVNLNLGLTVTSALTGFLLVVALFFQFRTKKYIPSVYWIAVVLISVFGTLVTDNLTDSMGVSLEASTIFFSIALAFTFALWYAKEKTLSIHAIYTGQREAFYWLAILFTFALGTASGDLMAEGLGLGYVLTGIIVAGVVFIFAGAWRLGLNPVLSFWLIYIMTRPLGASLGDFLSQSSHHGGLGWGATLTSVVFLTAILGVITYLSVTKKDTIKKREEAETSSSHGVLTQTFLTVCVILVVAGIGYHFRQSALQGEITNATLQETEQVAVPESNTAVTHAVQSSDEITDHVKVNSVNPEASKEHTQIVGATTSTIKSFEGSKPIVKTSPLGDLSSFATITQDTLNLVLAGKSADAKERIGDLEYEWDNAEAKLKRMNGTHWTEIDDAIDGALRQVRAVKSDTQKTETSLRALLGVLNE